MYKKAVTLKDVAESSGYSLRTVKKVLSSNEPVKPATRETVLRVAREMGYRKNRIASVLANHKVYKIAIVIGNYRYFFPEAKEGFRKCYRDMQDLKVNIDFYIPGDESVDSMRELLRQLVVDDTIDAVIMHARSMSGLNEGINRLVEAGKLVFTFGADAPFSKRLCYVGPKAYETGRIAAQLMANYIGKRGEVYVINQSEEEMQTLERNRGIKDYMAEHCKEIRVHLIMVQKREEEYYRTVKSLVERQQADGILGTDADCHIVGEVLREQKNHGIVAMGFDLTEETEKLLREDYIQVILSQNPEKQAYTALQKLCEHMFYGTGVKKNIFTDISVITSECLKY
ncbi:MAG: LacI family DNA-binding transcriptional regulator [Lachnospiraceae bacterium]|nr:LacI family DNA-binding transcriptional regulator [Lachnospiraceae bacterium]